MPSELDEINAEFDRQTKAQSSASGSQAEVPQNDFEEPKAAAAPAVVALPKAPIAAVSAPTAAAPNAEFEKLWAEANRQVARDKADTINKLAPDSIEAVDAELAARELEQRPGFGAAFAGGVERNINQLKNVGTTAKGIYGELTGDQSLIDEAQGTVEAREAQQTPAQVPGIEDIYNAEDLGYWISERLGEQAGTIGAMIASGGLGAAAGVGVEAVTGARAGLEGLAVALRSHKLISTAKASEIAASSIPAIGAASGAFVASTALETAGTAQEQFALTEGESYNPGLSLGAGAVKGALELYAPHSFIKALERPGKSILTEASKTAVKEGLTEATQELVDVAAKKYTDPSYDFFSKETGLRIANSAAAGFVVGGGFSAGALAAQKVAGLEPTDTGSNVKLSDQDIIDLTAKAGKSGPLTALRKFAGRNRTSDVSGPEVLVPSAEDVLELNIANAGFKNNWKATRVKEAQFEAIKDLEDDNLPRYTFSTEDGVRSEKLLTAADLEVELAKENTKRLAPAKVIEVAPGSLQAAAITANVWDLPDNSDDNRVFVLPGKSEAQQQEAKALYASTIAEIKSLSEQRFSDETVEAKAQELYLPLIRAGVRVVPTRNSSFYYGEGTIAGKEVGAVRSQKSISTFTTSGKTTAEALKPGAIYNKPSTTGKNIGNPIALDYSKIPRGSLYTKPVYAVSEDPTSVAFAFSKDSTSLVKPAGMKLTDPVIVKLQSLFASGVVSEADSKWVDEQYKKGVYLNRAAERLGELVVGKALPANAIVYGSDKVSDRLFKALDDKNRRYGLHTDNNTLASDSERLEAKKTADWLLSIQPILEVFYDKFKAKAPVSFVIQGSASSFFTGNTSPSAYYIVSSKVIVVPHNLLTAFRDKAEALAVVLHEFGHAITLNSYSNLPAELQARVLADADRARLRSRITGSTRGSQAFHIYQQVNVPYYTSTIEHVAEQFRRYALSDPKVLDLLGKYYQQEGQELKTFYQLLKDKLPATEVQQLLQADSSFYEWMDYLEEVAKGPNGSAIALATRGMKLGELSVVPEDLEAAYSAVRKAINNWQHIIPKDVTIQVNNKSEAFDERYGEFNYNTRTLKIFAGAIAVDAVQDKQSKVVVHEALHSIFSVLSDVEKATLLQEAKNSNVMSPELIQGYRDLYDKVLTDLGYDLEVRTEAVQLKIEEELVAHLVEERINGKSYGSLVNKLLDSLIELWNKLKQLVNANGVRSADDLLRAFYRGEMTRRYDSSRRNEALFVKQQVENAKALTVGGHKVTMSPQKLVELPDGNYMAVQYHTTGGINTYVNYRWFQPPTAAFRKEFDKARTKEDQLDWLGAEIGFMDMTWEGEAKGWDISYMFVHEAFRRQGFNTKFLKMVQDDLNTTVRASGVFLPNGMEFWRKKSPAEVKYHVWDKDEEMWLSPNYIKDSVARWQKVLTQLKQGRKSDISEFNAKKHLDKYSELYKQVDKKAWKDKLLSTAHALERDGMVENYRRGQEQREGELRDLLTGPQEGGLTVDPFVEVAKNENVDGLPVVPEAVFGLGMFNKAGQNNPKVNKHLAQIKEEAVRIGWMSKKFFGIQQLAWRNPNNVELNAYVQTCERWNSFRMNLISKADETVRQWDKFNNTERQSLSDMLFWVTEMKYLTSAERTAKVIRLPTPQELMLHMRKLKFTKSMADMYVRINTDFLEFLDEVELSIVENIKRTVSDPALQQAALNKTKADMQMLKSKPYFPMVRFGKYHITVRDPQQNNKVVWFSAYPTIKERDAAVAGVKSQYKADDLFIGAIPEQALEFMGMPPALIQQVRANLPGISTVQRDWLEQFELLNSPQNSFKKRWMERQGTPGYSLDALRIYSHYFRSGANYLARVKYKPQFEEVVQSLTDRTKGGLVKDSTKHAMLVDTLNEHLSYILEGGKDWAKFKGLVTVWQLGASIAAASLNLTQTPMVTYPFLSSHFGDFKALGALSKSAKGLRRTRGLTPLTATTAFDKAHEEMVSQGRIDTGQASELGSFAEARNLDRTLAGSLQQKSWRWFSYYSMWMFSKAEQLNREVTFKASYDLAMSNPNAQVLKDISVNQFLEKTELQARLNVTDEEAVAFLYARTALDKTQFMYSPYSRPEFLRGPVTSSIMVFFSFTLNMLYALTNNPGAMRMWLIMLAMYGFAGLPFSDDLDKLLNAFARLLYGKDFSLQKEARQMARDLTEGTFLDAVGPDLFMHGVSRYSFGLGLINDGYGVPKFDASANGSMGQIIPGFSPGMAAAMRGGKWDQVAGQVAQDVAGAGFGQMFNIMQFLGSQPGSSEWKRWEKVMPRSVRAMSKSLRYASEGVETTPKGGVMHQFDLTDPDDVATIVAQFAGFTPTVLSQKYESSRSKYDLIMYYQTRRTALFGQLDYAIRMKDTEARSDVMDKIKAFNLEVGTEKLSNMLIKPEGMIQSLKKRAKDRAMESQGLPTNKKMIPFSKSQDDLYPDVIYEKKVK
jgi:hypothetical protein